MMDHKVRLFKTNELVNLVDRSGQRSLNVVFQGCYKGLIRFASGQ